MNWIKARFGKDYIEGLNGEGSMSRLKMGIVCLVICRMYRGYYGAALQDGWGLFYWSLKAKPGETVPCIAGRIKYV